jgi:hypothetical protein
MGGRVDGWVSGWMDGLVGKWRNECLDGWRVRMSLLACIQSLNFSLSLLLPKEEATQMLGREPNPLLRQNLSNSKIR